MRVANNEQARAKAGLRNQRTLHANGEDEGAKHALSGKGMRKVPFEGDANCCEIHVSRSTELSVGSG